MNNLTRIKQGDFKIEEANSLEEIKNNNFKILHIKDALDIKEYKLNDLEYKKVSNGNKIELQVMESNILLTYKQKEVAIYQKMINYISLKLCLYNTHCPMAKR